MRRRTLRATVVIRLHDNGPPQVTVTPEGVAGEELVRLALAYGAKLRWVLLSEPRAIQEEFRVLTAEVIAAWDARSGALLDSMPRGRMIRDATRQQLAVPGGEQFKVRYCHTLYKTLRNMSSVYNMLPRPGLAINVVWNFVILMDFIYGQLDIVSKVRAHRSLVRWYEAVFAGGSIEESLRGLRRLLDETDFAWETSGVV